MTLDEKYTSLLRRVKEYKTAAVALSGGVDSAFLCFAAHEALGPAALAITVASPMLAQSELDWARRAAAFAGIRHIIITGEEIEPEVAANPPERCYLCKKVEFGAILKTAKEEGAAVVMDGTNSDDDGDYRPGLKALAELAIQSPLRELGFSKADVRALSRQAGLPTWDKPSCACLASRVPYGEPINAQKLAQIERAEAALRELGFTQFRVRHHGSIARVEVAPGERQRFFDEALMDAAAARIKEAGFLYAALELEGYRMGSLNAGLKESA